MLLGSAAASPYYSPTRSTANRTVAELQFNAIKEYIWDPTINYDLLPSVTNRVMLFGGMKVRQAGCSHSTCKEQEAAPSWVYSLVCHLPLPLPVPPLQ